MCDWLKPVASIREVTSLAFAVLELAEQLQACRLLRAEETADSSRSSGGHGIGVRAHEWVFMTLKH